jgi:hypothetical protein
MDLRLMRQSGDPYGREELVTAIAYTEVLQFLYQHLMNHIVERNGSFAFSFGDKKWFDRIYPVRPASAPHPSPAGHAVPVPSQAQPAPQVLHV